jgi:hypothetical protein
LLDELRAVDVLIPLVLLPLAILRTFRLDHPWRPFFSYDEDRWWKYFDKLFNEDSGSSSIELDISSDDLNRQFMHRIQKSEVKYALKRMRGGKTMGPDGIPIEVWRTIGDVAIVWLTKLFNLIFRLNKMPDEWRRSILIPIF